MNLSELWRTSRIRLSAPSSLVSSTRSNDSTDLLADELVLDQAGAVDQADGLTIASAPLVEHSRERAGIAHVGLGVGDGGAGLAEDLEVLADFASAPERLIGRFDLGGARRAGPRAAIARARPP